MMMQMESSKTVTGVVDSNCDARSKEKRKRPAGLAFLCLS
jgi:hypothetical protein